MNDFLYVVVVVYKPRYDLLRTCIDSIYRQCLNVVIVDNSCEKLPEQLLGLWPGCRYVPLFKNCGIGKAQNVGINVAMSHGARIILLSDQDTIYRDNYILSMYSALKRINEKKDIAAICPNFYDVNRSELCPMIVDAGPLGFKLKVADSGLHKVCFANASGMLIPAAVFHEVGLMREDLFIDCVDTEWCARAEHLGYSIYCNADVVITHSLGDKAINFFGRVITQHTPLRHYYLARNNMYLALHIPQLSVSKRLFFFVRAFKRVVGHAVLSAPRLENLTKGLQGLWHGLTGRLGKHA